METAENKLTEQDSDNNSIIAGFTFLHFINDTHSTALPAIIPILVTSIGLSLGQAGLLNALFGVTNIIAQPITGYFADRQSRPYFAICGPLLSVTGACLLPLSPSFGFALFFIGLMSLGTSLFHPQATGLTGSASNSKNLTFMLSLFAASGSLGSAVGPLYIAFIISEFGKKSLILTIIPVFLICVYIWKNSMSSQINNEISNEKINIADFIKNIRSLLEKVGGIVFSAALRDATFQGIKIFLPMLIILKGGTIKAGGFLLFAVTIASTISGIVGGKLATLIGDENIFVLSLTISPIFLILGLNTTGIFSILILMLGAASLQLSTSATTAMAQNRCPGSRSAASSLTTGVAWGLANVLTTPVGFSADLIGLPTTLNIVALMPWTITAHYLYKKAIHSKLPK
ncbi:MAG: MFS transporter [Synergistaceae bacterium]|nr:MFS transporter [Synergistaceae bacterium]